MRYLVITPMLQAEEGYQAQLQQEMQQLRERQYDDSELDAVGRMQVRSLAITPRARRRRQDAGAFPRCHRRPRHRRKR